MMWSEVWHTEVSDMFTPSPIQDAIMAANQQFMASFSGGDAAGIAQLYTEDGQVLPPGMEPIAGRPGIQAFWQGAMDMGVKSAGLETLEVTHLGDSACEVGRFVLHSGDGQILDQGKYVVIWKRHGSDWQLHRDIWNSNPSA